MPTQGGNNRLIESQISSLTSACALTKVKKEKGRGRQGLILCVLSKIIIILALYMNMNNVHNSRQLQYPCSIPFFYYVPANQHFMQVIYGHRQYLYLRMSSQLFKKATAQTIKQLLNSNVAQLTAFDQLPSNYRLDQHRTTATAEYSFGDFKEAHCFLNLIAQSCSQLNYYPQIFNVYNRIEVTLYSQGKEGGRVITERELYVSHLINELVQQKISDSHGKVLAKLQLL